MDKPYSVNLWETHPDNQNDDCSTGESFQTLAEARACLANLDSVFNMAYYRNTPFVELDGPDVYQVVERPGVAARKKRKDKDDGALERSEHAMQQGMGLGIHAYNEAMGGDSEECPDSSESVAFAPDGQDERDHQEWLRDMEREQEG